RKRTLSLPPGHGIRPNQPHACRVIRWWSVLSVDRHSPVLRSARAMAQSIPGSGARPGLPRVMLLSGSPGSRARLELLPVLVVHGSGDGMHRAWRVLCGGPLSVAGLDRCAGHYADTVAAPPGHLGRLAAAVGGQLERCNRLYQMLGLLLQRARGGGGFLHQRGVLLGALVHVGDDLVDLLDA